MNPDTFGARERGDSPRCRVLRRWPTDARGADSERRDDVPANVHSEQRQNFERRFAAVFIAMSQ